MTKVTSELLTSAGKAGMWVMLSVYLIIYTLYTSNKRECKNDEKWTEREKEYQEIIKEAQNANKESQEANKQTLKINRELVKKLETVDLLRDDVKFIKEEMIRGNKR